MKLFEKWFRRMGTKVRAPIAAPAVELRLRTYSVPGGLVRAEAIRTNARREHQTAESTSRPPQDCPEDSRVNGSCPPTRLETDIARRKSFEDHQ
jgi:hypothetical protein